MATSGGRHCAAGHLLSLSRWKAAHRRGRATIAFERSRKANFVRRG